MQEHTPERRQNERERERAAAQDTWHRQYQKKSRVYEDVDPRHAT
jgi:hypothetical protein